MLFTPFNWTLNTYTVEQWTPVVTEPSSIATFSIANTNMNKVTVSVRLVDAQGNKLAVVLPDFDVWPSSSELLDVRSINVIGDNVESQAIEVKASGAGVEFLISGVKTPTELTA